MIRHMKDLIRTLNDATRMYEIGKPIMSDKEWDDMYFQLSQMERETGVHYGDSPTSSILYNTAGMLIKKTHNHPMLSLEKTKNVGDLVFFFGGTSGNYICMEKMDGLTCSLEYQDGHLIEAETRGNGIIGESVLHNALHINSIPEYISDKRHLIIDGEIISTIDNFTKVNKDDEYKNPRNFAAGSIRLLNSAECAKRNLDFVAWDVIEGSDKPTLSERLDEIQDLGFEVVPFINSKMTDGGVEFNNDIQQLREIAKEYSYPIDGVVFRLNNYDEYNEKGRTEHHFNGAMAFKFYDEEYETILRDIEWSMGRTGKITPVAIFDPVEIDGTTVNRASLHNVGIMRELGIRGNGQHIEVAKMNMIIPQVTAVLDNDCVWELTPPSKCPMCGADTTYYIGPGTTELICSNDDCPGKILNKLDHFCSKKGLDIKGISKATLEDLMANGWLNSYADIFCLRRYEEEWVKMIGYGKKSVAATLDAIDAASHTTTQKFICAIGIPQVGQGSMKDLLKYVKSYDDFRNKIKSGFDFSIIPNIGPETNAAIKEFDYTDADEVSKYLTIDEVEEQQVSTKLTGLKFVITGKLKNYKNRKELETIITDNGGSVVSSVTTKTDYLIANAVENTAKYNNAVKFNVPIINEEDFKNLLDK